MVVQHDDIIDDKEMFFVASALLKFGLKVVTVGWKVVQDPGDKFC